MSEPKFSDMYYGKPITLSTSPVDSWSLGDTYWTDADHTIYVSGVSTGTNLTYGKSYLPETRCNYCGRLDRDNSETCNGCGALL